jgi:hypothetical protein
MRQYDLKLKPKKCLFFQREFLGRMVSEDTLAMAKSHTEVVRDWPTLTCSKDVERFMGLANNHRHFVKDFSTITAPLYSVVGKHKFKWDQDQHNSFTALKKVLTEPPVLALSNREDEFILDTDASDVIVGAELNQVQNGVEKVVAAVTLI